MIPLPDSDIRASRLDVNQALHSLSSGSNYPPPTLLQAGSC
jgi:hypothetical protein